MREGLDNLNSRNPLSRVQSEIANILRNSEWMNAHNVEIIEQNSQALSFLLQKSAAQINNVIVIIGVDDFENNPPVLEATSLIEVTASSRKMTMRTAQKKTAQKSAFTSSLVRDL